MVFSLAMGQGPKNENHRVKEPTLARQGVIGGTLSHGRVHPRFWSSLPSSCPCHSPQASTMAAVLLCFPLLGKLVSFPGRLRVE